MTSNINFFYFNKKTTNSLSTEEYNTRFNFFLHFTWKKNNTDTYHLSFIIFLALRSGQLIRLAFARPRSGGGGGGWSYGREVTFRAIQAAAAASGLTVSGEM